MSGRQGAVIGRSDIEIADDLKGLELQKQILAELRKIAFLMERLTDVDIDVEAFNGRN